MRIWEEGEKRRIEGVEKRRGEKARQSRVREEGQGRKEDWETGKGRSAMRAERAAEAGEKSRIGEGERGKGKWREGRSEMEIGQRGEREVGGRRERRARETGRRKQGEATAAVWRRGGGGDGGMPM